MMDSEALSAFNFEREEIEKLALIKSDFSINDRDRNIPNKIYTQKRECLEDVIAVQCLIKLIGTKGMKFSAVVRAKRGS